MLLRSLRLLTAGLVAVAAVCLAPAHSRADVQILVEELDASQNVVASHVTSGVPDAGGLVSYSFSGQYFTLGGTVSTTSDLGGLNSSLTPSFSGRLTSSFDATQDHSLRITVTDDKFTGNGFKSTLTNSSGVSRGFAGSTVEVNTFSQILDSSLMTVHPSSKTGLATGSVFAGPTSTSSSALPNNGSSTGDTSLDTSGLPATYAIQQVILVSFTQSGDIPPNSTFGGSGGASIMPSNGVPAPGGLALVLAGLPLIGLRRVIRKNSERV